MITLYAKGLTWEVFDRPVVPPPPPPVDPTLGVVTTIAANMSRMVVIQGWMGGVDRYERDQHAVICKPTARTVRAFTLNISSGGSSVAFGAALTLFLTLDGVRVAQTNVLATDVSATFTIDATTYAALAERWYWASVEGLDATWSVLPYGVYIMQGNKAQPHTVMPVVTASHELVFEGKGRYQTAMVPAVFAPTLVPYDVTRTFPDLPTRILRGDVVITSLAPARTGDVYRPARTIDGVWTTANRENYFYYDVERPLNGAVELPMLDGPRGRGSIIAPVHLEVGNAAPGPAEGWPDGPKLVGNVYFIESWRFGKVRPDGTVVTIAGARHKDIASYWNDPLEVEMVGDWRTSGPAGFAQPWGLCWDVPATDYTHAPIATERNLRPHVRGVRAWIADTYNNRVVVLTFDAYSHAKPPIITDFVVGLNNPWDCIRVDNTIWISDRRNNRIVIHDMDSGALVRSIPWAQPEGMALLDRWMHVGSVLTKSIQKINVDTGEIKMIADPSTPGSAMGYYINNNSRYMKIAVSDGTFSKRGDIAWTTWSNSYYGYPCMTAGDTGVFIDWISGGPPAKGTNPPLGSYSTAVGIGHGRMLFGTAEDGLHVVSKALPTDVVVDKAKFVAGSDEWQTGGYRLTHGDGGYGFYGLPLPWGKSANIDAFLTAKRDT